MVALLARTLGVEAYGNYTIAITFSQLFAIIADVGISIYLLKKLSASGELNALASRVLGSVVEVRVATAIIGAIIALALTVFLPYTTVLRHAIAIALVAVVIQMVNSIFVTVLQTQLEMKYASLSEVVGRAVMLGGAYIAIRSGLGVSAILVAQIFGNVANLVITIIASNRFVRPQFTLQVREWTGVIHASMLIGLSSVLSYIYFKTDTFLLSILHIPGKVNSFEVGLYGSAYKVLDILIILPGVLMGAVFPLLTGALARKEMGRSRLLMERTFDVMLGLGLGACGGLVLFSGPIIHFIAGSSFAAAAIPLSILALAVPFNFVGSVFSYALLALERQRVLTYLYATAAIFNIVANALLIPHYSYIAAAWTTGATEVIVTIGAYLLVKDIFPLRFSWAGTGNIIVGVVAASVLPLFVPAHFLWLRIGLFIVLLGATAFFLRTRLLSSAELHTDA